MAQTITEDEIGKHVLSEDGDKLGMIASVEGTTAFVEPEPGLIDRVKGAVGWESDSDDLIPISEDAVTDITDDEVHLEREFTTTLPEHQSEGPVAEMGDEGGEMPSDEPRGETSAAPIDSDEERPDETTEDTMTDPMGAVDEGETRDRSTEEVPEESIEEIGDESGGGASRETELEEGGHDPEEAEPMGGAGPDAEPIEEDEGIPEPEHLQDDDEEMQEPEHLRDEDEELEDQ